MNRIGPVLILVVIFLSGCAFNRLANRVELKEPEFSYTRHVIRTITESKADVEFIITAHNPNAVGLRNVFVDYVLLTEGGQFLKGEGLPLQLAPSADTEIAVPTEIIYADLINAVGPLIERIFLNGNYSIPVTIKGVIYGKPTFYDEFEEGTSLFSFTWEFSRTEEIPLPERQMREFIMQLMLNPKAH